jgi:hypothetical protein
MPKYGITVKFMLKTSKKQLFCGGVITMSKDNDVQRCTCGAWYYIGRACGFCEKWRNRA